MDFYENGEKTVQLLARQLKHRELNNSVTAIRKEDKLITSAKGISKVFKNFCTHPSAWLTVKT